MNLLTLQPPRAVEIDGYDYKIRWDFKTSVQFEIMMQDCSLSDETKLVRAIDLYYPVPPQNTEKAIDRLLYFYRCGRQSDEQEQPDAPSGSAHGLVYSFEYDHEYIYAAFLDQYGIDLQRNSPHWWVFRALFKALKEDHKISKIMEYRSIQINSSMTNEQRAFYQNMKKIYRIPSSKLEKQKVSAIESALIGDGDLTGIL